MPRYRAFGVPFESAFSLTEPEQCQTAPELRIERGPVPEAPDGPVEDGKIYPVGDGHYCTISGVGTLFARDGRTLTVTPAQGVRREMIRQLILGEGFRLLLYQRGYLVLHASAALVDGQAVAFIGESGRGKSTTAAACHAEGHSVLTDDVTAVDPQTTSVQPGFPRVKLDPSAAESLRPDVDRQSESTLQRQYYPVAHDSSTDPPTLGCIYQLADGPDVGIETIPPAEQPYRLMCASTTAYHSGDDERVESHLADCVRLSETVPVKRLERPRRFRALPNVVRAIEADVTSG